VVLANVKYMPPTFMTGRVLKGTGPPDALSCPDVDISVTLVTTIFLVRYSISQQPPEIESIY